MRALTLWLARPDVRLLAICSALLVFISGAPFLYAALNPPAGYVFSGIGSLTPGDNPIYYSYIRQVIDGNWLLRDLHTPELVQQPLLNIVWLGVGVLAKALHLIPPVAFHVARLLLIPAFVGVAWVFLGVFFSEFARRRTALVWLLCTSGLGAYAIAALPPAFASRPGFWSPPDVWVPEAITFLTLYRTPHFIVSLGCLLLILTLFLKAETTGRLRFAAAAGGVGLLLFNFHPFYVPSFALTLAVYICWRGVTLNRIPWRSIAHAITFFLLASPSIIYHAWTLQVDPVLAARGLQNVTLAPPFIFLLIGYGVLWPLATLGIVVAWRDRRLETHHALLLAFGVSSLSLIFSPVQFQSRYTEGVHPVLVVFSILGWERIRVWRDSRGLQNHLVWGNRYLAGLVFIILLCSSNIFAVMRDAYLFVVRPNPVTELLYLPQEKVAAFEALAALPNRGVVLALSHDGLIIPGMTGKPVLAGHGIETIHFEQRARLAAQFFASGDAAAKARLLRREGIGYVLVDKKNIGSWTAADVENLEVKFENDRAAVYAVIRP